MLLSAACLLLATGSAQAAGSGPVPYEVLRQREDWSKSPDAAGADRFDSLKHLVLSRDGGNWLSVGGQARVRLESIRNAGFGEDAGNDDGYALYRAFLHGDLHLGEHVRLFAQLKSASASDYDLFRMRPGPGVRDDFALQTAFAEFRVPLAAEADVALRVGRQELAFGAERLTTAGEWANTRLTFDGVSALLSSQAWSAQFFLTHPVAVRTSRLNRTDRDRTFWGLYAQRDLGGIALDLYYLGLERKQVAIAGGSGTRSGRDVRQTGGVRLAGALPGTRFDIDLEAALQGGHQVGQSVRASMLAVEVGYSLPRVLLGTRLFMGVDYASGDRRTGADGTINTFDPLFQDGHRYFGFADAVGRQNVESLKLGVSAELSERVAAFLTAFRFRRAQRADALYGPGGALRFGAQAGRDVGFELDAGLNIQLSRHLSAAISYNHLFAGEFLEESGASDDIGALYASMQYTF